MLYIFYTASSSVSKIDNVEIRDNSAYGIYMSPNNNIEDNPCYVEVSNSRFIRNIGPSDAFIKGKVNSHMEVKNSYFEENFTVGRGGVVMADNVGNQF
jgi:hypothetical protein